MDCPAPVCVNALHIAKFPMFLNYRTPFSRGHSQRCHSSDMPGKPCLVWKRMAIAEEDD